MSEKIVCWIIPSITYQRRLPIAYTWLTQGNKLNAKKVVKKKRYETWVWIQFQIKLKRCSDNFLASYNDANALQHIHWKLFKAYSTFSAGGYRLLLINIMSGTRYSKYTSGMHAAPISIRDRRTSVFGDAINKKGRSTFMECATRVKRICACTSCKKEVTRVSTFACAFISSLPCTLLRSLLSTYLKYLTAAVAGLHMFKTLLCCDYLWPLRHKQVL